VWLLHQASSSFHIHQTKTQNQHPHASKAHWLLDRTLQRTRQHHPPPKISQPYWQVPINGLQLPYRSQFLHLQICCLVWNQKNLRNRQGKGRGQKVVHWSHKTRQTSSLCWDWRQEQRHHESRNRQCRSSRISKNHSFVFIGTSYRPEHFLPVPSPLNYLS
jgi:hypothetical protein